ncbi:C-type lectin domain family 3 member A-like [Physella acuta]|uniref:C-type lectin domain family 3 member A-like n=1 Tax=Physella acuta TaxID=109671 RepID=UPI0027DDA98A|nr:C-type lectin domain family 3 member A-like [Physella acuta]
MGTHLYSVNTIEKLTIIKNFINGRAEDYWVGLNDIDLEDHFVSEEDGMEISVAMRNMLFYPGQPNGGRGQNCVRYDYQWYPFSDYDCAAMHRFLCELSPP